MIILEKGKYNIGTVRTITEKDEISASSSLQTEGIVLSKKNEDGTLLPIGYIRWDKKQKICNFQCIGLRLLDIEEDDWSVVRSLLKTAYRMEKTLNMDE